MILSAEETGALQAPVIIMPTCRLTTSSHPSTTHVPQLTSISIDVQAIPCCPPRNSCQPPPVFVALGSRALQHHPIHLGGQIVIRLRFGPASDLIRKRSSLVYFQNIEREMLRS